MLRPAARSAPGNPTAVCFGLPATPHCCPSSWQHCQAHHSGCSCSMPPYQPRRLLAGCRRRQHCRCLRLLHSTQPSCQLRTSHHEASASACALVSSRQWLFSSHASPRAGWRHTSPSVCHSTFANGPHAGLLTWMSKWSMDSNGTWPVKDSSPLLELRSPPTVNQRLAHLRGAMLRCGGGSLPIGLLARRPLSWSQLSFTSPICTSDGRSDSTEGVTGHVLRGPAADGLSGELAMLRSH